MKDIYSGNVDFSPVFDSPATAMATEVVIRTCSAASETSQITGDGVMVQEESLVVGAQGKASSKWTNEKHSLFLKSIEASFVDQLYSSLDMLSYQPQNSCRSDAISTWKSDPNTCVTSGQLKILRRGYWSKKRFNRANSHLKDADKPHVSPGSPWIQHFRNASRKRLSSTATSPHYPLPDSQLDQELGCSKTEVTGQNFVEETPPSRKRMRTSYDVHSSNDQVVPNYTTATSKTPDSNVSPKKLGSISFS